jgi:choline kinase
MKVLIIGAGRGRRLQPFTDDRPKCQVPIAGRPILDWILDAFRGVGLTDFVFIGGYRIDYIRERYPDLTFVENRNWETNNILLSLFCAEAHMSGGFYTTYADTLLDARLLRPLVDAPGAITLSVDTSWNERHGSRPGTYDAHVEASHVDGNRVTRLRRIIPPGDALGEFTGVARFTAEGAETWRWAFHDARARHRGKPFHHAATFETAYLVDLLQELIDRGTHVGYAPSPGGYVEIDTLEDYELANRLWAHGLGAGAAE